MIADVLGSHPDLLPELKYALETSLAATGECPSSQGESSCGPPGTPENRLGALLDPTEPAPAVPPVQLPDYELLCTIGRGTFGQVWVARNRLARHYCAVKLIPWSHRRELDGISEFKEHVRGHPQLVPIEHVAEAGGYVYCVMPLADSVTGLIPMLEATRYRPMTLEVYLNRRGKLSVAEVVRLGIDLAGALEHLHTRGVLHGDFKPGNVMCFAGVWCLGDYSLMSCTENPKHDGFTPYYCPPEGAGSRSADQYALAMTLFQLAVGLRPDQFADMRDGLVSIGETPADVELQNILLLAGHPDATRRYASLREVRETLLSHRRAFSRESKSASPSKGELAQIHAARGSPAGHFVQPDQADVARSLASLASLLQSRGDLLGADPLVRDALARLGSGGGGKSMAGSLPLWLKITLAVLVLSMVVLAVRVLGWSDPAPTALPSQFAALPLPPLELRSFTIEHLRYAGPERDVRPIHEDTIGDRSDDVRVGDEIHIRGELSRAAYYYLVALNTDGTTRFCPQDGASVPPRPTARIDAPKPTVNVPLREGPGLQGFVLLASDEPLPAYDEWVRSTGGLKWDRCEGRGAWMYDGRLIRPLTTTSRARPEGSNAPRALEDLAAVISSGKHFKLLRAVVFEVGTH